MVLGGGGGAMANAVRHTKTKTKIVKSRPKWKKRKTIFSVVAGSSEMLSAPCQTASAILHLFLFVIIFPKYVVLVLQIIWRFCSGEEKKTARLKALARTISSWRHLFGS